MADLDNVTSEWVAGVRQIETTDPVLGGPPNAVTGDGMVNIPHLQLAQRTQFLKDEIASLTTAAALLTKIKTVDGAGTGLDADLLDGKQGAAYWQSSLNPALLATAGYQIFQSGLVLQWGRSNDTNFNITFPIAFPSAAYVMTIGDRGQTPTGFSVITLDRFGATVEGTVNDYTFSYIAIGV